MNSLAYIQTAIQRIESGGADSPFGSHVVGIFGKAANQFEKDVRSYFDGWLQRNRIDYDIVLRSAIKGPIFQRLTLGQCIAAMEEVGRLRCPGATELAPGRWKLSGFLHALGQINKTWVGVKHGDAVGSREQIAGLRSMISILTAFSSSPQMPKP